MAEELVGEAVVRWAAGEAATRLAPLGDRWLHVQGVANQARLVAPALPAEDRDCLVAAAYLHDIGRAPELVDTGFHPIDGGRWVRRQGLERLACLVAHHSAARFEAELLGLGPLLDAFELEESATADALAYCDATSGPAGALVSAPARWAEIAARYGEDDLVTGALARARPSLEQAVARTEELLRRANIEAV